MCISSRPRFGKKSVLKVLVEHVLAPVGQQVDVEKRVLLGRGLLVELLQDLARIDAGELVQERHKKNLCLQNSIILFVKLLV